MPSHKMPVAPPSGGGLLAWITRSAAQERFVVAFVGAGAARDRAPTSHQCATRAEAEQWVTDEAAALSVPIEWVAKAPIG
jgi:hypothetical protein